MLDDVGTKVDRDRLTLLAVLVAGDLAGQLPGRVSIERPTH